MPAFDPRLPQLLKQGRPIAGVFVGLASPALVEMVGHAGFDFVVIDNEHGPAGIETTEHLIRAAQVAGTVPVVRVTNPTAQEILRTLDAGASAVQVPQVNTPELARQVVQAAKYPPLGTRGTAFSVRAAGYTFFGGPAYMEAANAGTAVITHIETAEAVRRLDELLAVDGIDVYFIGPTDLSVSLGHPGQIDHPEVQATIADVIRRTVAAGKVAGIMVRNPEEFRRMAELGARFITFNIASLIAGALRGVVQGIKG